MLLRVHVSECNMHAYYNCYIYSTQKKAVVLRNDNGSIHIQTRGQLLDKKSDTPGNGNGSGPYVDERTVAGQEE